MTLAELVYGYLDIRERSKDNELWAKCPFCDDDQYRMGINLANGKSQCFRGSCGFKSGSKSALFAKLCEVLNISGEILNDSEVEHVPKKKKEEKHAEPVKLPKEFEPLWKDVDDALGKQALKYVQKRGITEKQILRHKLGFCGAGKYSHRIVFPVTYKKRLYGLVCRDFSGVSTTDSNVPRYLNSEGTKTLYNVPKKKRSLAVLSEGPIDALAIERAFRKGDSLGRLGSTLTDEQYKILRKYKEICIWPDPDKPGVKGCISVAKQLLAHKKKVSVVIPVQDDVDPGKLGETEDGCREIRRRIKRRIPFDIETTPLLLKAKIAFD